MLNKKILLAIIAIVMVVAVGVVAFSLGVFAQTTEVDNKFIKAKIPDNAYEDNSMYVLPGWQVIYHSTENNLTYAFGMIDTLKLTGEWCEELGLKKISTQTYNGIEWDIYYESPEFTKNYYNESFHGYMFATSGKNGDCYVEVSSDKIIANGSLESDLFKEFAEPLLNSIILKDPKNPPKEYQFWNMTKLDYDYLKEHVKKNGWAKVPGGYY